MKRWPLFASLLVAVAMVSVAVSPASAAPYYQDKTVQLLVPFGPGGGTDVWSRFVSPFLHKYVEGEPTVIVQNRPGGGSITGANYFAQAVKADGYTALVTSGSTVIPYLLGDPAVRYKLNEMQPIIASPVGGVIYVSPSTGITEAKDLGSADQLIYAGISPTGNDLVTLLAFEVLDVDVLAIMGYNGRGPARVAFERGESNIDYQTTPAYLTSVEPLVDEGVAVPMMSFGILDASGNVVRDPVFPELPTVKEVYEEMYGEEPSGIEWEAYRTFLAAGFAVQKILWVKGDTPQPAVDALVQAGVDMNEDPEFFEKGRQIIGDYRFYVGEGAIAAARSITDASDEVLEWVKDLVREEYGVTRY